MWQKRIGRALSGQSGQDASGSWTGLAFGQAIPDLEGAAPGFLWSVIDVRDIGQAQRLMATSSVAKNGSRCILGATDESGELTAQQMRDALSGLYPDVAVGGEWQTPGQELAGGRCSTARRRRRLVP